MMGEGSINNTIGALDKFFMDKLKDSVPVKTDHLTSNLQEYTSFEKKILKTTEKSCSQEDLNSHDVMKHM